MFEASTVSSPSLLLANLSDPTIVTTACQPILNNQITSEEFMPDLIINTLVPQIKRTIREGTKSQLESLPLIVRLIIDNYPDIGYRITKQDIIPTLKNVVLNSGVRRMADVSDLFVEVASTIPSHFRDDIVCDLIYEYAADIDYKIRNIAVNLIPVIHDNSRVIKTFRVLANDSVPSIRLAIVKIIPNVTFEDRILHYVLLSATRDSNLQIRQRAASIFGQIAPNFVKEYCKLISNKDTVKFALPSFPHMVEMNSFAQLIDAFFTAARLDKNDAALALLEAAEYANKSETSLFLRAAQQLTSYAPFAWHLFDFAAHFECHDAFIELLNPASITDWRTRFALLKQCELFAPHLGYQLTTLAEAYSEDAVAVVRTESVQLWAALIKDDLSLSAQAELRLMRGSWRKRQVLAKLMGIIGFEPFKKSFRSLANDPVTNVRALVRELAAGTPWESKM